MGGGVGVSAHGGVRITTERSRIAMPETGIGFVPDVGGTFLLARAPGELGTHLALTGNAVGAGDALLCGLADHFVPSDSLPRLLQELAHAPVREVLDRHAGAAPAGVLAEARHWIDACYSADTVEEIVARLQDHGDGAAKEAAETLLTRSPTALKVTRRDARGPRRQFPGEGARPGVPRLLRGTHPARLRRGGPRPAHRQGPRPRWSPATLAEVTDADVAGFLAPIGARELGLSRADFPGEAPR